MVFSLGSAPVANPPTLRFEQNGGTVDVSSFLRTGYNNYSKKTRCEVVVNGGVLNLGTYLGFNYSNVSTPT